MTLRVMKRLIIYLLAGASLPLFSRFQETVTYQEGQVIHEVRTYGQTGGILLAGAVVALLVFAMRFDGRFQRFRACVLRSLGVGLFALPALWNRWTVSQFDGVGYWTQIKAGTGGPLAPALFFAAAAALVVVEAYLLSEPPDDHRLVHA